MDLVKTLSYNYVFKGVPEEKLSELAEHAMIREFLGGDQLVRQFDKSADVFLMLEGQAISKTFTGEVVARFGPGSVVGEVSLIDGEPRSTNVVSVGTSKAAIVPARIVREMMDSDPQIGYAILNNLAKVLCRRLRSANEYIDSLTPAAR